MSAAAASSSSSSSSAAAVSLSRAPRFSEQPGHFHGPPLSSRKRQRGEGDEDENDAPADSRVQLYRHALESIFSFLHLDELVDVLAVSREWQSAVGSMRSMQNTRPIHDSNYMMSLIMSRLRRHVSGLSGAAGYTLTLEHIVLLHMAMPHLLYLHADNIELPSESPPPRWPQSLQWLSINHAEMHVDEANQLLQSIGQLSQLRDLLLGLQHHESLSFAALAALPLLRFLSIDWPDEDVAPLNDAQVAELRTLAGVEKVDMLMDSALLMRLLQPPHQLRWHNLPRVQFVDDAAGALLPSLSCLSQLKLNYCLCTHFDFLPRILMLTDLTLGLPIDHPAADAASQSMMDALQHCPRITSLTLIVIQMPVISQQLAACLGGMPALSKLEIHDTSLPSFSFLSVPSLALSLQELSLYYLVEPLPALLELRHLHGLRSLRRLTLFRALAEPLDAYSRSLFEPPSVLLPQLEYFSYTGH